MKATEASTSNEFIYAMSQVKSTHAHTHRHTNVCIDVYVYTQLIRINTLQNLLSFTSECTVTGMSLLLSIILSFSYVIFSPALTQQGSDTHFMV